MKDLIKQLNDGDPQFFDTVGNHTAYDILQGLAYNITADSALREEALALLNKVRRRIPMNLDLEVGFLCMRRYLNVIFRER